MEKDHFQAMNGIFYIEEETPDSGFFFFDGLITALAIGFLFWTLLIALFSKF